MPTENRSSNTEMVSVPREPSAQMLDAARNAPVPMVYVDSMRARQDLEFSARYKAAISQCTQPAPQPHPDPIAWMVGTAFWWNKEEAERDAAASGKTITPFGPMFDTVEVERLKQELLAARAQGRAEVVEMIAQLDAETGLDEFIGSHQIGCSGEWGSHWKEEALREHFDVDPAAAGELELARHSSYEIMLLEEERDTLRAQLDERDALLTDISKRHWSGVDFDLPADLIDRIKALSASAEPGAPNDCAICRDLGNQCMECEEGEFRDWADRHFAAADYRKTDAGVFIQDWMRHSYGAWCARGALTRKQ